MCLVGFIKLRSDYSSDLIKTANDPKILNRDLPVIWSCVLYKNGGRVLPPIKYSWEVQRYILSLFLHKNLTHLVSNIFFLLLTLKSNRTFYTDSQTIGGSVLSGILSNIMSGFASPHTITVGFSPCIFGLVGMFAFKIIFIVTKTGNIDKKILKNTLLCLVMMIFGSFGDSDTLCHALGIIFGAFIAASNIFFSNRLSARNCSIFGMVTSVVITSAILLSSYGGKEEALSAAFNMGCN